MDHLSVPRIDADMGNSRCIIGPFEENNVTGLCFSSTDRSADIVNTLCSQSAHVIDTGISKYIAYKSGTVKTGRWTGTAPDIWHTQIFFGFFEQSAGFLSCKRFTAAVNGLASCIKIKIWIVVVAFV